MTVPASSTNGIRAGLSATGVYPGFPDHIPTVDIEAGRYRMRFARSREDLDAVLRLRFEVFNLELGEGLDDSFVTGRDEDELDSVFHHLMIAHARTGEVVGTYRMQTGDMARAGMGFYSSGEFDLDGMGQEIKDAAVEIGRACVAREHRNGRVIHLLWRGLAAYLSWNRKQYLFGCCSLPTLDVDEGRLAYGHLRARGCMNGEVGVEPLPAVRCDVGGNGVNPSAYTLPPLFESYLRLGAQVCGEPAIDRQFKTIDFFVVLDTAGLDDKTYRTFFQDPPRG